MSVFKGFFYTFLNEVNTKITIEITKCYNVYIWFVFDSQPYKFTITTWRKLVGSDSFDVFARMMLERYKFEKHPFGSIVKNNNTVTITWDIVNMIVYSVFDVFRYIDIIMLKYTNEMNEYCSTHQHDPIGNYEEYIHSIACECLLDSKFSVRQKCYPKMGYDEEYDASFLEKVNKIE